MLIWALTANAQQAQRRFGFGYQEVQELLDQHFAAGRHQVNWDGRDHAGKLLSSGVCFMRMTVTSRVNGKLVQVRKMLVIE